VQAGFADPRFAHLSEAELDGLEVNVSILSHPRPVPATREAELAEALEPDRDGLTLGVGRQRALFLPSVWRQVADPREFVRHLILKAGLDPLGWPRGLAAAHFRVESFGASWRATSPADIAPARIDGSERLH
jgi:AmmeMemoRadiSam system protein A